MLARSLLAPVPNVKTPLLVPFNVKVLPIPVIGALIKMSPVEVVVMILFVALPKAIVMVTVENGTNCRANPRALLLVFRKIVLATPPIVAPFSCMTNAPSFVPMLRSGRLLKSIAPKESVPCTKVPGMLMLPPRVPLILAMSALALGAPEEPGTSVSAGSPTQFGPKNQLLPVPLLPPSQV